MFVLFCFEGICSLSSISDNRKLHCDYIKLHCDYRKLHCQLQKIALWLQKIALWLQKIALWLQKIALWLQKNALWLQKMHCDYKKMHCDLGLIALKWTNHSRVILSCILLWMYDQYPNSNMVCVPVWIFITPIYLFIDYNDIKPGRYYVDNYNSMYVLYTTGQDG
jgi:hypothetical protein